VLSTAASLAPFWCKSSVMSRTSSFLADVFQSMVEGARDSESGIELVPIRPRCFQKSNSKLKPAQSRESCSTAATLGEESSPSASGSTSSRHRHCRDRSYHADYVLEDRVLGVGLSGKVRQARCRATGRSVAVKRFLKAKMTDHQLQNLRQEIDIHLDMDHPHIARLERVYESDSEAVLVMECLAGGELFDRIVQKERLQEEEVAEVVRQCLLAVSYMHRQGLVHRDVKLENLVFLEKGGQDLKLIDFGYATRWDGSSKMTQRCGTMQYAAPEMLAGGHTEKCDLWSVGVVAYMLLTGKHLYSGGDEAVKRKVRGGHYSLAPAFQHLSAPCREFVLSLLKKSEAERPSAAQALELPWLQAHREACKLYSPPRDLLRQLQAASRAPALQRACLALLAWSLPPQVEDDIRNRFSALDKDGDGVLSVQDLRKSLRAAGCGGAEDAEALLEALDANGDGVLSFREVLAAASPAAAAEDEVILTLFKRFDTRPSPAAYDEDEECNTEVCSAKKLEETIGGSFGGFGVRELMDSLAPHREDQHISLEELRTFLRGGGAS